MKQKRNLVLLLFVCLSLFMLAGCQTGSKGTTQYELDVTGVNEEMPVSSFDLSLIRIKVTDKDGNVSYVNVNETMISEEDSLKLKTVGLHEITIIYKLFTGKVNVKLIEDPEGVCKYELDLTNLPQTLYANYVDLSLIRIKVTDKDGNVSYVNVNEGMLNSDDKVKLTQVGTHEITITYKTLVRKVTLVLTEKPKDVITYELDLSKVSGTQYTNTFVLSDVRIKVNTNGNITYVNVDSSMISKDDLNKLSTAGTHTITVSYKDYKGTFNITLLAPEIGDGKFNSNNSYYKSANGKSGMELKLALREIISVQTHTETYDDLKSDLPYTDEDPDRPGYMKLIYSDRSVKGRWDSAATWNREHVWPQSKGWFSKSGAGADIQHLRPEDPGVNSSRGNKPFSENGSRGTFTPRDDVKGDVARILFYLLTRYSQSDSYQITVVATSYDMLVRWNRLDPVDDFERQRNNRGQEIQGNRNPFIDHPEAVDMIWGTTKMLTSEYKPYKVEVVMYIENEREDYLI